MLGRVLDPLGRAASPRTASQSAGVAARAPIDAPAPGIVDRQLVEVPLHTGVLAVDAMLPLGRGQRQLIIGDRKTGKTALALDAVLAQRDQDVVCVWCTVGQKASTVRQVVDALTAHGMRERTLVVVGAADAAPGLQWIAPQAATAMAEQLRDAGRDVLIVYDDLTRHAATHRQIALLLRQPPGREAYPGDVFYVHSRLLERAAKLSDAQGGGSLTALPVIETQAGDVSAYIPTNVISITDGQIYLEADLFNAGQRPAINVGLSVSRVGGAAQTKPMNQVAGPVKLDLANYRELAAFSQFASDLDAATQRTLARGARLTELFKQGQYQPLPMEQQVLHLLAGTQGFLDDVELTKVQDFLRALSDDFLSNHAGLLEEVVAYADQKKKLKDGDLQQRMLDAIGKFKSTWKA
ncbi:MAG: F0F1 ATP synthase subunit alpha [Myxococcota bacterium]